MTKKYISCEWLEHGLVLDVCNIVRNCSYINPIYDGRPIIYENYYGEIFDWENFWNIKNRYRENALNNIYPEECTNCECLCEKEYENKNYIKWVLLTPWVACNSKCIYCYNYNKTVYDKKVLKKTTLYSVLRVMKDFVSNNAFSPDVDIDFAGGEPTIFKEFNNLIDLFIKNGIKNIVVHTNAIKHSKSIEKAVRAGVLRLLISVDAGSKEVHKKIKQVNSYDAVWKNIKKYVDKQPKEKNLIRLKYIIVPGINDTVEEIDKWLLKSKSIGINSIVLNLDHKWLHYNFDNKIICNNILELMDYTLLKAEELGMQWTIYPQLIAVSKKYIKKYKINSWDEEYCLK